MVLPLRSRNKEKNGEHGTENQCVCDDINGACSLTPPTDTTMEQCVQFGYLAQNWHMTTLLVVLIVCFLRGIFISVSPQSMIKVIKVPDRSYIFIKFILLMLFLSSRHGKQPCQRKDSPPKQYIPQFLWASSSESRRWEYRSCFWACKLYPYLDWKFTILGGGSGASVQDWLRCHHK